MAGAGRDTIEELLKEFYIPPVVRQINDEVLMLKRLEASADEIIQGLYAVVPVDFGRTAGIGPARERGALPEAGNQSFKRAIFNLKFLYGRGAVTGPAMATTKSDAGSFLRVLKAELDGLQRDLRKDLARQVYGDNTGSIAALAVDADTSDGVLTLVSDEALRKGQIYVGMRVAVVDSDGTTENGSGVVADVDITAKTVSIGVTDPPASTASGDFLARAGSVDADGHIGVNGLAGIIDDTAELGGLDPADAGLEEWASIVNAVGGAWDTDELHTTWNDVRVRSGASPTSIVTSFGIARAYFNDLQAQVQYVEPMKIEGGYRVLEFMGVPFIGDVDCPFGTVFLPDEKAIKVFATSDFAPLEEDGHFLKWVTGYDMWEFALARYMELGANRRNSSAKLTGITDATGT